MQGEPCRRKYTSSSAQPQPPSHPAARPATGCMAHRIGQHPRRLEQPQQGVGVRLEPARMARLDRDATVMPLAPGLEECLGLGCVEHQTRWQLHQQAAQALTQPRRLPDKFGDQRLASHQPAFVRDGSGQLGRKTEISRNAAGPALVASAVVRALERGVDFHAVQARGIALEVAFAGAKGRQRCLGHAPAGAACVACVA